jgi:acyl carrier protein
MTTTDNRATAELLRPWLVQRVADYTERDPATIDPAAPLSAFGLDSVYALALCGEIEDYLGVSLEATVIWDHPSVDALVAFLCDHPAETRP